MSDMRSSKRQKELLNFVDGFIQGNGYGPSYREIMRALGYKSVSTVAIHINELIRKGYLHKRDKSARSLAVITTHTADDVSLKKGPTPAQERWLINAVTERFDRLEQEYNEDVLDELYVLIGALKILDLTDAHLAMKARLADLKRV
jgi:SOS-response transcriptional repressor LexA